MRKSYDDLLHGQILRRQSRQIPLKSIQKRDGTRWTFQQESTE